MEASILLEVTTPSTWPQGQTLQRVKKHTVTKDGFANEVWSFPETIGTHACVPAHFATSLQSSPKTACSGWESLSALHAKCFAGPCVVIDLAPLVPRDDAVARYAARRALDEADPCITVEELASAAATTLNAPTNDDGSRPVVLLRLGWPTAARTLTADAFLWLMKELHATVIGADCPAAALVAGFTEEQRGELLRSSVVLVGDVQLDGSEVDPPILAAAATERTAIVAPINFGSFTCAPARVVVMDRPWISGTRVIDCSQELTASCPTYPGAHRLQCPAASSRAAQAPNLESGWTCGSDVATHVDSPAHFFDDGRTITDLKLTELIAPCVVIDVAAQVFSPAGNEANGTVANADYTVSAEDIIAWENRHGQQVPRGAVVCARTGWSTLFTQERRYRNGLLPHSSAGGDDGNADDTDELHFPGFGEQAARFLLQERSVAGIGIDTLSLDAGSVGDAFIVHQLMLGAGKFQVENLTLEALIRSADWTTAAVSLCVLPIRVAGSQEAWARCLALVEPRSTGSNIDADS
jgi:kynurenine formamidase